MFREESTEVLVAGAGPVGMITAILLAESGIRVKVVDKESGTATHSYSCAPEADSQMRRHVQELLKERAPWFEGTIGEIVWSAEVQFEPGVSRQFGQGRCWLAGDAAHQTGPVGMQSMNVGLREAAELVGNVKKILREQGSPNLLNAYASNRREEWLHLLGTKGELKPSVQTNPWIRERGARILPCLPTSGEHLRQLFDQIGLDLR